MFAVASYDRAVSLAHAVREALPGLAVCATRLV